MAFDSLSDKLQQSLKSITGKNKVNEADLKSTLREIRLSLLEADVNIEVVKKFVDNIKEQAFQEKVIKGLDASQQVVKIVKDELTELLGGETKELDVDGNKVIMMVGLQGSGKTTSSAKLANYLRENHDKKPFLIAADVYRPAAIDQLIVLADQIEVPYHAEHDNKNVIEIVTNGLAKAKEVGANHVIIDTAGRTSIDQEMMNELVLLLDEVRPDDIIFVQDSMLGQEAANVIKEFNDRLAITGAIMTKLDGDARGGAALSIKTVADVNILFMGTGEKIDNFDVFHPDRMAQRILGMGDVLSLIEKAENELDQAETEKLAENMLSGEFTYDDFLGSMNQMKKLGSFQSILKMMPGNLGNLGKLANQVDDAKLARTEAIIMSMTKEERITPKLMNYATRKQRIAKGAGVSVNEVNQLVKQFEQMRKMMKSFGGNPEAMLNGFDALAGGNPAGMMGGGMGVPNSGGQPAPMNMEAFKAQRKAFNKKQKKKKKK